jgi:cysteinyl-tRNA synthetase
VADVPEEVLRLARERDERRRARDFQAADDLRDRIRELGYDIEDTPSGSEVLQSGREPPQFDFSLHWIVEGWPHDVVRGIEAFRRHHPGERLQMVVIDTTRADPALWPPDAEVSLCEPELGWAAARNAGLGRAAAPIVVVVDGSVEPAGDILTPLRDALADPAVGVVGPFGLVTEDLRDFRESGGPEVDAIEGYLMAFRREVLTEAGSFDEGFRFYRAADLDLSFRIKDRGLQARVVTLPVIRHEHRVWATTPQAERERLSKRNFYRFLDRWKDRFDLCVASKPGPKER